MSLNRTTLASVPAVASYPLIVLAVMITSRPHVAAAPKFSDWATPTNLGCQINSPFGEQGPAISKEGLSLYFASMRPDGFGASDIWVSQRASVKNPWGPPLNLGAIVNTPGVENIPALSRDGHWLFFNSDRAGTSGILDIWVSYRKHVHDDFAWQPPVNLGAGVNSQALEAGASYLETEQDGAPALFFGRAQTLADFDIYVSELQPDRSFGEAVLIPELSSAHSDQRPAVRFDGLELFLSSDRPGSLGLSDLWVSTRETVFDAWETPTNLGPTVNSAFADMQPYMTTDRQTLFFTSNRPGGCGALDLYVTTRTKIGNAGE
jgi:WD40-like Beta Propeller Repeat